MEKQLILQLQICTLFYNNSAEKCSWRIKIMQSIFEILFVIGDSGKICKGKFTLIS